MPELKTEQVNAMFQPGCFVMLHPISNHPDAGRVGRVIKREDSDILVEFFSDDLIGCSSFCDVPMGHWGPVPEFFVEEYEPRAKKRGWRVTERGLDMFKKLGWGFTPATEGKA